MVESIFKRLQEIYPEMVNFRRELHMYPELSHQEENTPKKIADFLSQLGLEVRVGVGGRGVVAILRGGKPGKTVGLRADFDALPIQEENDVDYKSRIPGVMHACGHDIHTAALLGVAKALAEVKETIAGNIVFIHQFAEEVIPGGAKPMIEDGCLDGVDVIYGAHVSSIHPVGTIGVKEGATMAAGDTFEIDIFGKGGHAATPHLTIDPIVIGSQIIVNLQQIVGRKVDPIKSAVVSVAAFNSGIGFNVIPDKAKITGTVRTFDEDVRDMIESLIGEMVESTCKGSGATATYKYVRGYPAVKNHPEETKRIEKIANHLFGQANVKQLDPQMGMEDFAYYLQKVPGTFFFVGGNSDLVEKYPHHNPKFDVDERSMLDIGKLFVSAVFDYLSNEVIEESELIET
ncbi:M20 family metallopeptidase [Alkalihalobacillus sp. BA299]|uniref:M20 metallopeptidase family protein n=1 Tax=Alkalihalobacillus sp. BA299 TaxID=2815938 RepID=UPI001ADBB7D1|nr:amidohydrolase [Alkalihalobacillus sp. BA299]